MTGVDSDSSNAVRFMTNRTAIAAARKHFSSDWVDAGCIEPGDLWHCASLELRAVAEAAQDAIGLDKRKVLNALIINGNAGFELIVKELQRKACPLGSVSTLRQTHIDGMAKAGMKRFWSLFGDRFSGVSQSLIDRWIEPEYEAPACLMDDDELTEAIEKASKGHLYETPNS